MIRRIWTIFKARNNEFFRDHAAYGWNLLFPFLVIIGFSIMFNEKQQILYKVGVVYEQVSSQNMDADKIAESETDDTQLFLFKKSKYTEFIDFPVFQTALDKLKHHRIDFLINPATRQYWLSTTSPKGYMVEKLLQAGLTCETSLYKRENITGSEIHYSEWLFPGVLGMNIMFSALYGVGYTVVRYRKNGVLKRFSVTPLRPYEFLAAQIISRMYLLTLTTLIVFLGCMVMFDFRCQGSYWSLLAVFFLGGFSMISVGLVIAARSSSEEFANGILNLISWPMMFLSEVWFSLEGTKPWVKTISTFLPLTHLIDGARKIMNDGASLYDIRYQISMLAIMAFFFFMAGSILFKWNDE
ncbi:MAG: ABC transporter permease [Deltaproteobacteria bacterium]|nr:MAG: ABC transporter permease [Deltaproteobacteria bacterium]